VVVGTIEDISRVMTRMMEGDFSAWVTAEYQGKYDELKKTINSLGDSLKCTVRDVDAVLSAMVGSDMTALQSKQTAETGGKVVQETVKGMERIARVVRISADTVKAASSQQSFAAEEISKSVESISTVTAQTAVSKHGRLTTRDR